MFFEHFFLFGKKNTEPMLLEIVCTVSEGYFGEGFLLLNDASTWGGAPAGSTEHFRKVT